MTTPRKCTMYEVRCTKGLINVTPIGIYCSLWSWLFFESCEVSCVKRKASINAISTCLAQVFKNLCGCKGNAFFWYTQIFEDFFIKINLLGIESRINKRNWARSGRGGDLSADARANSAQRKEKRRERRRSAISDHRLHRESESRQEGEGSPPAPWRGREERMNERMKEWKSSRDDVREEKDGMGKTIERDGRERREDTYTASYTSRIPCDKNEKRNRLPGGTTCPCFFTLSGPARG